MEKVSPTYIRYSESFQKKVVEEIRRGKFTMEGSKRYYDIRGATTVKGWLKKWGTKGDLAKKVIIEMPDEVEEKKKLKEEIKKLKIALADSVLKNQVYETLIEVVDDHYKADVKKTFQ